MYEIQEFEPFKVPQAEYDWAEFVNRNLGLDSKKTKTALRGIYKVLNEEDIIKNLDMVLDRYRKATSTIDDAAISRSIHLIAGNIKIETKKYSILTGAAANALLINLYTEQYEHSWEDKGVEQLRNELLNREDGQDLITVDEINDVFEKLEIIYPGINDFIADKKLYLSLIDAYKSDVDGLSTQEAPVGDASMGSSTKNHIILFRPYVNNNKKVVLLHEICHMLIDYLEKDKRLEKLFEIGMAGFADVKRAEKDGEEQKCELLCNLMEIGILDNDVFKGDDYYDMGVQHIRKIYSGKALEQLKTEINQIIGIEIRVIK